MQNQDAVHAGSRGAPSYLERQLHSGNLMVWEAGARQPGSPPPGYGPVAMGPGAVPCTSHVFARHNQVSSCFAGGSAAFCTDCQLAAASPACERLSCRLLSQTVAAGAVAVIQ